MFKKNQARHQGSHVKPRSKKKTEVSSSSDSDALDSPGAQVIKKRRTIQSELSAQGSQRPLLIKKVSKNSNVSEEGFSYSSTPETDRITAATVDFVDERDNYMRKTEYVEDPEGVRENQRQ